MLCFLSAQRGSNVEERTGQGVCGRDRCQAGGQTLILRESQPQSSAGKLPAKLLYPNLAPTHLTKSQNPPVFMVCESQKQLLSPSLSSCPPGLFRAEQTSNILLPNRAFLTP